MRNLISSITFLFVLTAQAQLPETEIFLAEISIRNNLVKIEKAENITNHKGYDNQPFFLEDKKQILFSSESDSDHKIHIKQYDFKTKKISPVTNTSTSEYSPMLTPDGKNISSVVVEEDSTQRIWLYDAQTGQKKSCLTEKTDSIGYYSWIGSDSILYYKLSNPHSLRALDLKTGEDNWLCDHPARSFRKINEHGFFYVIHEEKQNLIYLFDTRLKKAMLYATDAADNQDYAWQNELGLVKSEQSKLYHYSAATKVWAEVADFSSYGIKKITRFAFNYDNTRLAVVSNL